MNNELNRANPLISYCVLVLTMVLGFLPFLMMSAAYGTINTERWSAYNASFMLMMGCVTLALGILFYIVRENNVNLEEVARGIIDVDELKGKKYVDYLLAHYGNVAGVAAFFAALTFVTKSSLQILGVTVSSLMLSVSIPVLFVLYGLVFAKSGFGAQGRHPIVVVSLLPMLVIDATLFMMAIKSVPQL